MTDPTATAYRYWAFISYSSKDAAHAKWLHRAIETYGIPAKLMEHGQTTPAGEPAPRRFHPVFRDREELSASADLGKAIEDALRLSRYLIVICSPHAAQSKWVNREIETFAELGHGDRVFAYIVDGRPNSGDEQECFPPALKQQEPLAADARRQGDRRNDAKLKLLAGMLGVSFDMLKRRDAQRRVHQLEVVVGAAFAFILVLAGLAWYANQQRVLADLARQQAVAAEATAVTEAQVRATAEANAVSESHTRATAQAVAEEQRQIAVEQKTEAERQARLALSGQLATQSRMALGNSPDLALLFAAEAFSTYDTFQARSTLLSSLLQSPHLDRILRTSENATALAFSPDGKTLASAACTSRNASQDCTESGIQFWDLSAGVLASQPIPALPGWIRGLVYAPDGKSLFVGGTVGAIRQWDVAGQRFTRQYTLNETTVTSLAVSSGGRTLAAGNCYSLSLTDGSCEGGALAVWDLAASEPVSVTLDGGAPDGQGLALSPDGQWLVAGDCARREQDSLKVDRCVQGEVRRWRLPDGALERYPVAESSSAIVSVAFAPDGKTLFAGESKGSIYPLDAATLQAAGSPFRTDGALSGLLVSPQLGGLLIGDSFGKPVQVWRLSDSSSTAISLAARQGLAFTYSRALSGDGRILATSTCPGGAGQNQPCPAGSEIQLWDLVLWHPVEQFLPLDTAAQVEVALPAGSRTPVAFVSTEGQLRRLDLSSGKPAGEVLFQGDPALLLVRLSPDGRRAATVDCVRLEPDAKVPVCLDSEVRFWDTARWESRGLAARLDAWVLHAAFSPDASKLAVDGPDDRVVVLDAATGAQLQTIATQISPGFRELSFSADSDSLAVSGCLAQEGKLLCQYHDVVKVFDVATGQEIGTAIGPFDASVTSLAMGPAGRDTLVAVGLYSFSGKEWGLWDWKSGAAVGQPVPSDMTTALAFSPDGRLIAATNCQSTSSSNCGQYVTTLWDLDEQQAVGAPLIGNGSKMLVFSPDGGRLVSKSSAGLVVSSLDPVDWRERACRMANRNLTVQEWKTYEGDVDYHKTCPGLP